LGAGGKRSQAGDEPIGSIRYSGERLPQWDNHRETTIGEKHGTMDFWVAHLAAWTG